MQKKHKRLEKIIHSRTLKIFICLVVLVSSIGITFYQSKQNAYGYSTVSGVTKSQRYGYASVDVGNSWISIRFENDEWNTSYSKYNDKAHTIKVALSNKSEKDGCQLSLVTTSTRTYATTGNATIFDFTIKYTLPSHVLLDQEYTDVLDAPQHLDGKPVTFVRKTYNSGEVSGNHTVTGTVTLTASVYAVGLSAMGTRCYGVTLKLGTIKYTHDLYFKAKYGDEDVVITGQTHRTMQCGELFGELPKATRKNYYFSGWYNDESKEATTTSYLCASKHLSVTYYAEWTQKRVIISYNSNGGNGFSKSSQLISFGTKKKLFKCDGERPGYKFMGWGLKKDGPACFTDEQLLDINDSTISSLFGFKDINSTTFSVKIYAIWQKDDANFDMTNVLIDDSMFINDRLLKGHFIDGSSDTSYGYDKEHIDSEYARPATKDKPGYFTNEQ